MLGFIHITKTGGTDIKDKNENKEIIYGQYHFETAALYKEKKMNCFAIIRHPVDRYMSLYYYNTQGSSKYRSKKDGTYTDINHFVFEHYANRHLINKYEKGMQFRKQVDWLANGNPNKTFIVKFDKVNLVNNIAEMCKFNKITFRYKQTERVNITNYDNMVELSKESREKIKEMYKEDLILYKNLMKLNKPFCKLSEIIA
jgi:hypothetical protein